VVDKDEAGYYNVKRKSVDEYLRGDPSPKKLEEDSIVESSLKAAADLDPGILAQLGFQGEEAKSGTEDSHLSTIPIANSSTAAPKVIQPPLCDRCHKIKHHDTGVSIHHPSIKSIEDTIFESPYKINHVYHVLDAADFPMSLIPGLHKVLNITPQRSLNRRSKTGKFFHGQKTDVSFVITRSDLLAPKKEQVDSMMPYLRDVLRDALGRAGKDVRLGNVRCVSAKQSWWTKDLKEDIWKRGGGGWMVGKVNVGKSQLFGEIFPKGRRSTASPESFQPPTVTWGSQGSSGNSGSVAEALREELRSDETLDIIESGSEDIVKFSPMNETEAPETMASLEPDASREEYLDNDSLLPPPQQETNYPEMPLVSSLPGTTASPIRVPFGNGRGELIDLPGLARGDLELHVQPEHRSSLIMRSRIRPEQQVIKPGQSLLLGGFIRITPATPDVIFLAYNFNPLKPHLTSTERAIGTQTQTRDANVENISLPGTGEKIASAGTFHLKWDVTRQRTGPVTSRQAANIKVDRLPYRVMAADILIESVGWVEVTAQIRKPRGAMFQAVKKDEQPTWEGKEEEIDPQWPTVEVFSPEGRFIGVRKPLNAWLNFAQKPSEKNRKARPRRSMKGAKKNAKRANIST
jgi:hypothetical protein